MINWNNLHSLSTFLAFLKFPLSMASSIENVWITALMIHYATPNIIDAFIWIIPNIIAILIRPYCIRLVHRNKENFFIEFEILQTWLLVGSCGCLLVALSVWSSITAVRIVICTLGWTLMDVGFELTEFFSEKFMQTIKKEIQLEEGLSENLSFYGEVCGYLLSIGFSIIFGGKKFNKFRMNCAYCYGICAIMTFLCYLLVSRGKSPKFQLKQSLFHQNALGFYLPGFYQCKSANLKDRLLMLVKFLSVYMVDCVLIYTTMWTTYAHENQGESQASSYNKGMLTGSVLLLMYTIISSLNLKISSENVMRTYSALLFLICLASGWTFWFEDYLKGGTILVLLIALADNIFSRVIEPEWEGQNDVFSTTKQLIERMQSIFILCPMPFISMILLERDDILDCMVLIPMLSSICLLFWALQRGHNKEKRWNGSRKVRKVE